MPKLQLADDIEAWMYNNITQKIIGVVTYRYLNPSEILLLKRIPGNMFAHLNVFPLTVEFM